MGSQQIDIDARKKFDLIADRITMSPRFYETVLSLVPNDENTRFSILDLGSGQGLLLRRIRSKYPNSSVFGVDFSKELVYRASKKENVNCIMADVLHIPIAEKSMDYVFCTEVIEHVNDPKMLLSEIRRLLKPTGKLIITVPNRFGYYPAYAFLKIFPAKTRNKFFSSLVYWFIPDDDPALSFQPVDHAYSSKEVLDWIKKAEYDIIVYTGYGFFKNLRLARVQERIGRLVSPILAYNFFIVARPTSQDNSLCY